MRVVKISRTTRVTAGGKRFKIKAIIIIGDKNGKVGMGIGKGLDPSDALEKAKKRAKKQMIKIPIINGTIPHSVEAKFGAVKILLNPGKKSSVIIAGSVVRTICELVGLKNISSKIVSRSKNRLNNIKATFKALKQLKHN